MRFSLQGIYIRNSVLNALRNSDGEINIRAIPMNFVYNHPSISSLANYIVSLFKPSNALDQDDYIRSKVQEMEIMVEDSTKSVLGMYKGRSDVVVLTGSTGGLGSVLLAKLLECDDIERVYAINRKGSKTVQERHTKAFEERGLDSSLLGSKKLVSLEGNFSEQELGLSHDIYEEVRLYILIVYWMNSA